MNNDVYTIGNKNMNNKSELEKKKKEAAAQQKFQDKRMKAFSDLLMLVNHPEAAKRIYPGNCEVGGSHN